MTLILGAVAHSVAHQAGDRLVVVKRGKRLSRHDPLSNKQVVVVAPDALVAIGYAGLAYLGGRPTDDVIAEAVAGAPLGRGMQLSSMGQISPIYDVASRIADCLNSRITKDAPSGVEVAMVGLKRGKRERIEPLVWEIRKWPGAEVQVRRAEETPFDWRSRFAVQAIGDIDTTEIERTRQAIKALDVGIDRSDAISRLLVETIRRTSRKKATTVGADCMVVRLWRRANKSVAEVEFRPVARGHVSPRRTGQPLSFPAAYSPWFLAPGFIASPAIVKGDGGWVIGNDVEFRIRAPDSGPGAYFGSQDRPLPPT